MAYSTLEQSDINLSFWEACKEGDLDTFNALLPDASLTTPVKGCTPIIAAIQFRKPTIYLRLLADSRTDINSVNTTSGGHTVLHWAVMCGNIPAIETICSMPGVDLNIKNLQGETPIMLAVMCKNAVAVETLLEIDGVDLATETHGGVSLESVAKQWMDVTSRKDSAFRRDMSRIIVVLLGRARDNRARLRRERERREHQQEHERIRRQRMEQQRREHRDMHDRVRRNQEMQRDREAREHEEMHEFIRREIARMELRESIDSDDDEPVQAVVEVGAEEYSVVSAGGEREDVVEEVIHDNSDKEMVSQTVLELSSKENTDEEKIEQVCIHQKQSTQTGEESPEKVDSVKQTVSDGSDNEELNETVNSILKTAENKIAEILAKMENVNSKSMERAKSLKSLDAKHDQEKKDLKHKHGLEKSEQYIAFKAQVEEMTDQQEMDLAAIQLLKSERELNTKLHEALHRFEEEENEIKDDQETKTIAMFLKHETEMKKLKKVQKTENLKHLEEDYVMKKLKSQKKELKQHLAKLTAKPQNLPCPECPVCFDSMKPPTKILQCVNGHLVCVECARKVEKFICPTCKQEFSGRATAMEQFLRTIFNLD